MNDSQFICVELIISMNFVNGFIIYIIDECHTKESVIIMWQSPKGKRVMTN